MIITLIILTIIAGLGHKFLMSAVNSYDYDNTIDRYEDRLGQIYWDVIKDRNRN
jgi:hypothetical protein